MKIPEEQLCKSYLQLLEIVRPQESSFFDGIYLIILDIPVKGARIYISKEENVITAVSTGHPCNASGDQVHSCNF
jgi:hypothetical protein